jgi:hypothetical protein
MKCPHCLVEFHAHFDNSHMVNDVDGEWWLSRAVCPNTDCGRAVMFLVNETLGVPGRSEKAERILVYPKGMNRTPLPKSVPERFAQDYREACLVLADSPKASAALSRRCLQDVLREQAKVKPRDLFNEIQEVIDGGTLPSDLAENIDAIRNIGAFAAHPIKSKSTGEIVPVQPGEAEWNLEVLEDLLDFYFVRPAIRQAKIDALNAKLKDAGKPEMK